MTRRIIQFIRALLDPPQNPQRILVDAACELHRLDGVFDRGFVSFDDQGSILVSATLHDTDRQALNLDTRWRLRSLDPRHRHYLRWHRQQIFRGSK